MGDDARLQMGEQILWDERGSSKKSICMLNGIEIAANRPTGRVAKWRRAAADADERGTISRALSHLQHLLDHLPNVVMHFMDLEERNGGKGSVRARRVSQGDP
jgi:hypothetical protein